MRLFALVLGAAVVQANLDHFYCGSDTCYDVVGVDKLAKPKVINKACRKIASSLHPDVRSRIISDAQKKFDEAVAANGGDNSTVDVTIPSMEELEERYLMVNKACETLTNIQERKIYDDLLADPFRYKVMKRKYYGGGKNVNIHPFIPIILVLGLGTLAQMYLRKQHSALQRREAIVSVLISEQFSTTITKCIKEAGRAKELQTLKDENFDQYINELEILCAADLKDIDFGTDFDTAELEVKDMFFMRVLMFPVTAPQFIYNAYVNRSSKDSTKQDARRRTATALGMTLSQFNAATDKKGFAMGLANGATYLGDADELIAKKLWRKSNLDAYNAARKEEQMADVPKNQKKKAMYDQEKAQKADARNRRLKAMAQAKQL